MVYRDPRALQDVLLVAAQGRSAIRTLVIRITALVFLAVLVLAVAVVALEISPR